MLALIRDGQSDPPVVLRDVVGPEPAPDETLIEVHASSVNRGELALLSARPDGWRPGQDVAGIVTQPAAAGKGRASGPALSGLSRARPGRSEWRSRQPGWRSSQTPSPSKMQQYSGSPAEPRSASYGLPDRCSAAAF
jgi:NADPH:quinone reductase-like Zn-dependent oxidoreductase